MTAKNCSVAPTQRQPLPDDNPQELIRLGCVLLRILIQWATSEAATSIGRRITLLSGAAWLPSSGHGDTNAVAACLNLAEISTDQQLVRNNIPSKRPGHARMFAFADVTGTAKAGIEPITAPAIVANGLYTRQQVEHNLHLCDNTVTAWIEFNGLKPMQPGSKQQLFYGQDLIDFCRAKSSGIVKPKNAKEKAALRRGASQ